MPETLLRTKLHLPFTRPELVARPRLQEQIAQGLRGPLTLITAPAGFGKTTLLASYIASCGFEVSWLSLDKNDNQAERFLNYLIAALQEADQTIGNEAVQLMAASRQTQPEAVLTCLINDLDATGREFVLVLDDYQFISSQAIHEEVAFLLEHCPKAFHLVIASRSDPPLPLARLRAQAILGRVARVIHPVHGVFDLSGYTDITDALVGIIPRHPMSEADQVATLLGHESLDTTRIYTQPSERDLERAVQRAASEIIREDSQVTRK